MIEIKPMTLNMFDDWYSALDSIASEKYWLSFDTAPPKAEAQKYVTDMIDQDAPFYTAWKDNQFIGWCDISLNKTAWNKVFSRHIGDLGMAILLEWRGNGAGQKLITEAIAHAKRIGLEKIHLSVYSHNIAAKNLYLKNRFDIIGVQIKAFKSGDNYSDILPMERFL